MSDFKIREIKLFGRKIPLPEANDDQSSSSSPSVAVSVCADGRDQVRESTSSTVLTTKCLSICGKEGEQDRENSKNEDTTNSDHNTNDFQQPQISSDLNDDTKTISDQSSPKSSTTSTSQEKTSKKPDTLLPCPRCRSMNTKFCYYNNYNINQPRHFCKKCQRYWTAGGTMRSVPVGAGRRKNKSPSSNRFLQINSANNSATILNFGSNSLVSEDSRNGFYVKDCHLTGSLSSSDQIAETTTVIENYPGFLRQHVTFPPPPPWSYQWNSAISPPSFCPIPFYTAPPAYCGRTTPFSPRQNSTISHCASSPTPTTFVGKHSRDSDVHETARERNDSEEIIVASKSLGIDDEPSETVNSYIWSTLGVKDKKTDLTGESGFFKGIESKSNSGNHVSEKSLALEANPAALSRSLYFRECVINRPKLDHFNRRAPV